MASDDKCWLKPEQVEAMRAAARDGRHSLRDDALIVLMYDTGLRRAELSQLDRAMVDLEDGDLRIPTRIQKDYPNDRTPDPATFELDAAGVLGTVDAIEEYLDDRDDSAALFPSQKGSRMTPKGINDVVQRAARRAEIRPYSYEGRRSADVVSSHTLRHSVAWRMLRAEEDNRLYHVRNRLRHSSILTTEREYDHFQRI
ncbi:tyrosine-type recombinase/integrase [Saliphagus infecundisoli]|uniref:Tyrosine-type recombinase/integrase n=1 Tax=Saliphagus infecundisoli TaxID=1849069 RepID=A0ABD5QCG9_9EURY|nr:tyrosine-type recombinase/integrase [Saliphagus infecundisoli]